MFVIVDLTDEKIRRFEKYRKHIIETRRCDVFGGAPFFIAKAHGVYFDHDELEGIIKRCGTAIFKENKIPDGFQKYRFTPQVLPLRMLIATATDYFRKVSAGERNRTVCVMDKLAYGLEDTVNLCRYVRFVRVITERPDVYLAAQRESYLKWGAVMTVGTDRSLSAKSDCVIALSDTEFDPLSVKFAMVYEKKSACDNVFAPETSGFLPPNFKDEAAGIDSFELFSAIFETCGYKIEKIPYFYDAKSILFKTFT
ncbi:MAG: hypothetical protein MJ120_06095 [Clostridia bacterium]|nr:hypothetical protein [Clostridia bacterium]